MNDEDLGMRSFFSIFRIHEHSNKPKKITLNTARARERERDVREEVNEGVEKKISYIESFCWT